MPASAFLVELKETLLDDLEPIYVFTGKDAYLKKKVLGIFRAKIDPDTVPEFDYTYFKASNLSLYQLSESCLSFPFMHSRQVVVYDEADAFTKEDLLLEYLDSPSPTTILCIFVTDKRKINKLLKEHAKVISLDALDIHGFKKWMLAELKSQGLLIDRVAEEAILGYYRGNMLVMETQIEKLITYVGDAKHIRLADVKLQMSTLDEVGIFELIEYLTLKQKDKFLYKLHAIMQTGTSSQEIVGVLLWHFKRLWAVRDLQDKGLSSGCISSKLNLKEWVYKKVIPQVKRLHQRDFIKIFDGLYHLDINLKNKRIQGTLLLQEFAFYLSA